MKLEGSCHCGSVRFSVQSAHPYPFNLCYCTICRKTGGGGGYAINLGADYNTLQVVGADNLTVYHARLANADNGTLRESAGQRHFCKICGSSLWLYDPRWPDLVHPMASAIDTPLPEAPERTHLMVAFKPEWVPLQPDARDRVYDEYPEESLAEWHQRLGLEDK